jgi:hypothetical protein
MKPRRRFGTGPPLDDEEDYEMEVWAGVKPLRLVAEHRFQIHVWWLT